MVGSIFVTGMLQETEKSSAGCQEYIRSLMATST